MKVTTAGTPLHDHITFLTNAGTFASNIINQDNRIGIHTEFIANTDTGKEPGRPSVSMEFDENGELRIRICDKTSKNPVQEIRFKNGIISLE